jgi:hypothetical protein
VAKLKAGQTGTEVLAIEYCTGGLGFNSKREVHVKGGRIGKGRKDILCFRCQARMGCEICCEREHSLICTKCHNWANLKGVKRHGNIVPNSKQPLVRVDSGIGLPPVWKRWREGEHDAYGSTINAVLQDSGAAVDRGALALRKRIVRDAQIEGQRLIEANRNKENE